MKETPVHPTKVEVSRSFPSDAPVGADLTLRINVSCPAGCDLRGNLVTIMAPRGPVMVIELAALDGNISTTEDFIIRAPTEVGEYAWSVVFPRCEGEECVHQDSSAPLSLRTTPHVTSIAVWDIPSPVVINSLFTVKVGLKCAAGCQLAGSVVEISDDAGTEIGAARLADTVWPGTDSLYWAPVELTAPPSEGVHSWTARFQATDCALAHEPASAAFSCRTARPPEHTVTIRVTARNTGLPVGDVEVRVGGYEGFTDTRGIAAIELPAGVYSLGIRKEGYTARPVTLEVSGDLTVPIEALAAPTKQQVEAPVGPGHPYRD